MVRSVPSVFGRSPPSLMIFDMEYRPRDCLLVVTWLGEQ